MTGPQRFGPDELSGVAGLRPDELAAETRLARDLEAIAARDGIGAPADFTDRVMGAIAAEPVPAPAIAAGHALRHGALATFLVSVRDAFRVTASGGFPVAVRAQAFALVLLVAGVTAGSGYAAAGALGLLGDRPSPSPSVEAPSGPPQTPEPTDTPQATFEAPSPSPSPSAEPSGSPEATETAEPEDTDEPQETPEPARTPKATDDSSGSGGGDDKTDEPDETDDPDETPESDDD